MQGGSGVKDGRRGGFPWLHKRGFGSAEAREGPRRPPKGILDGAGDSHPPYFQQGNDRAPALHRFPHHDSGGRGNGHALSAASNDPSDFFEHTFSDLTSPEAEVSEVLQVRAGGQ